MADGQEGSLEDILAFLGREQHIILHHIMPHESGLVPPELYCICQLPEARKQMIWMVKLPFAGPGIHGGHALPSQRVQPVDHISEVEGLIWGGEVHLHHVWVLQVTSAAAQVVYHRHRHTTLTWAAAAPPWCHSLHLCHFLLG